MRRSVLIVLLVVLGLVGAACGNDDDGGSGSGSATTASSTTTTIPPASADKAKAEKIVLTQADLGAEFTENPDEPEGGEDDTPQADQAFRQCSQNNPVLNNESDERSADNEFSKGELTTVGSDAGFWTNEADFKAAMDILASDAFATCLNDAFKKLFSELPELKDATISNLRTVKRTVASSAATGVDQTAGLSTSLRIAAGPVKLDLFMDMVFLRKGRAGVMLMAMAPQKAYPSTEIDRLNGILATRLTANAT